MKTLLNIIDIDGNKILDYILFGSVRYFEKELKFKDFLGIKIPLNQPGVYEKFMFDWQLNPKKYVKIENKYDLIGLNIYHLITIQKV
jgi:hypothetical protein